MVRLKNLLILLILFSCASFEASAQDVLLSLDNSPEVNLMSADTGELTATDSEFAHLSTFARSTNHSSPDQTSSLSLRRPVIELPPVPLGFFCKFENNLGKKSPIPVNFGTD